MFLKRQALELDLPYQTYCQAIGKPILVITWTGTEPDLPSIVLNSHMDVVPVFEDKWSHPPFGAEIDDNGKIFARGTQDMKSVGMQYLEAIRQLKSSGTKLKRTIHITFVPDEEIGGKLGMAKFVRSKEFESLDVGFFLDEGCASEDNLYYVFYAERCTWHLNFKINGPTGNGSLLPAQTVGDKLRFLLNKMFDLRNHEIKTLNKDPKRVLGNVFSINLTRIKGGFQNNVIPETIEATFDIRIPIDVIHNEFEEKLKDWCEKAGGNIDIHFDRKEPEVRPTTIDSSNLFWVSFKKSIEEMGFGIKTEVFPGATDSRFIREVGIPAIGFSPINNTPILAHAHDEYLEADMYLKGIETYKTIISDLADV